MLQFHHNSLATSKMIVNQIFDKCVHDLEINGGYALLPLSELQSSSNNAISNAFDTARCAFDDIECGDDCSGDGALMPLIDPSSDSGGWTGYHKASHLNGRYNQHRQGFVFSNGEFFNLHSNVDFESDMKQFFHFSHDVVASGVLRAIERRLELPDCYFDNELGPTDNSSQWHLKQYQVDELDEHSNDTPPLSQQHDQKVLLPMHTDPSLISVVIIDSPGVNKGGKGLEVFQANSSEDTVPNDCKTKHSRGIWKAIPHHGRDVAIIFVGSVLSYLTKGQVFSAMKHRVVDDCKDDINDRMAATLFVRPQPGAYMKTLPSKYIEHGGASSTKLPPTFRVWNARVAKNYMKKKKKQKG